MSVKAAIANVKVTGTPVYLGVVHEPVTSRAVTPRADNRPTVVSLFSGCGGLDLGFAQAGYDLKWANDNNHWACETYRKNFDGHVYEGDIGAVDLTELPDCSVIVGGFPCQDFSMIWKRGGIDTERGNLYKYLVESVSLKRPRAFIGENVKGLLSANNRKAMETIVADFEKVGYNVKFKLVNFADYGVPQLRERVIIVGVRSDLGLTYEYPDPTNTPPTYVTAGEALKEVQDVTHNNEHQVIRDRTRTIIGLIPEGENFTAIPKDSPFYVKGMISHVYRRLHRDKPSTTIIAGGGGGTWGYHYEEDRPLTNRERARLFGYPDDFVFEGSITEVRRQIGNSVPPIAAKVFAESLRALLG